jgi:hypothetical protein
VNWLHLVQDRDQGLDLVNKVMKFGPIKGENIFTS